MSKCRRKRKLSNDFEKKSKFQVFGKVKREKGKNFLLLKLLKK